LIRRADSILVPTLVLFEVYKKVCSKVGEAQALSAVGYLSQNKVLDLDRATALHAADISLELGLPMADSIVLAHAQIQGADFITMDNDFTGIGRVTVIR
jgi:predicted nucleic acid-binding protein